MTQFLEEVLTEVYKLPPEKQDTITAVIFEELEGEMFVMGKTAILK